VYKTRLKIFQPACLHFSRAFGTIQVQAKNDSCNEVLRARADTYHSFMLGVSNPGGLKRLFFFLKPTLNIGKLEGGF
jgi:hypothetical protein